MFPKRATTKFGPDHRIPDCSRNDENTSENQNSTSHFDNPIPHTENGSAGSVMVRRPFGPVLTPVRQDSPFLFHYGNNDLSDDIYYSFAALFGQYNSTPISCVTKSSQKHYSGLYLEHVYRCPSCGNTYPIIMLHMMNRFIS